MNFDPNKEPREYGIAMSQWAPATWSSMYAVAYTFPENPTDAQRLAYNQWFTLFKEVLPCRICKEHFAELLKHNPVDTRSRETLTQWLVKAHNVVNVSLGKPTFSYEESLQRNVPPTLRNVFQSNMPLDKKQMVSDAQLKRAQNVAISESQSEWDTPMIVTVSLCVVLLVAVVIMSVLLVLKNKNAPSRQTDQQQPRRSF
jgi:hypothetical protein